MASGRALLKGLLERPLWRLLRTVFGSERIEGVEFIDIRMLDAADRAKLLLAESVRIVRAGGEHYQNLIESEIAFVAAVPIRKEQVSVGVRAYISPFRNHERWNALYLATRLVWTAAYFKESRAAKNARDYRPDSEQIRTAAGRVEREFVATFPEPDRWAEYLDGGRRSFPPAAPPAKGS